MLFKKTFLALLVMISLTSFSHANKDSALENVNEEIVIQDFNNFKKSFSREILEIGAQNEFVKSNLNFENLNEYIKTFQQKIFAIKGKISSESELSKKIQNLSDYSKKMRTSYQDSTHEKVLTEKSRQTYAHIWGQIFTDTGKIQEELNNLNNALSVASENLRLSGNDLKLYAELSQKRRTDTLLKSNLNEVQSALLELIKIDNAFNRK